MELYMNYDNVRQAILDCNKNKRDRLVCIGTTTTIKTKFGMSDEFLNSKLYSDIVAVTNFLPAETDIYHRIKAIILDVKAVNVCPICGNPCSIKPTLAVKKDFFNTTCGSTNCVSKLASSKIGKQTNDTKEKHRKASLTTCENNNLRLAALLNGDLHQTLNDKDIFSALSEKLEYKLRNNKKNAQFFNLNNLNDSDIELLRNILVVTKFIPFAGFECLRDLKIGERVFCILNHLTEIPKCEFCGKLLKFISVFQGYHKTCAECWMDDYRKRTGYPTLTEMKSSIDRNKFEIISFPQKTDSQPVRLKCNRCGCVFDKYIYNGRGRDLTTNKLCPVCDKYVSNVELEVRDFFKSLCSDVTCNQRTIIPPYEIDMFSESHHLAIEFNGLYYHSDKNVSPGYHLKKTNLCSELGIRLIHIFENEWNTKKSIVKSRLCDMVEKYQKTIYARKCTIDEVGDEYAKFLNENHIQGFVNSPIRIGLYYDGELVSLMTFGKNRFKHTSDGEFELVRFCNKLGYHIPGAASKILKYFETIYTPSKIISYCDRRWSSGNLYKKLGFTLNHISKPNYWYFKNGSNVLLSRIQCQKHKLKNLLSNYDEKLSESENMKNNGYNRIFDCGNLVFVKEYD